jgi:hypothetical protein
MMFGHDMMGYWSVWHWIIFGLSVALILFPVGRILGRLGFSPFWSVLALIPLVNLVALWVLALAPWRRDTGGIR